MTKPLPKRVLVDANFLIAWKRPGNDQGINARIDHLVSRLDKAKGRLYLPTPAIAEFLVGADLASVKLIRELESKSSVVIVTFDLAAAFDLAIIDRAARNAGDKRDGVQAPWQKLKVDRQLVAIAKANGCQLIVSEDHGVLANALRVGIDACSIMDLELPDSARQRALDFVNKPTEKTTRRKAKIDI